MNRLKAFLSDFPVQNGGAVVALVLVLMTGLIVCVRLALGASFPDGYEPWLVFLGALAGVSTAGMVGKRMTAKPEVIRAEGEVQAAVVAAQTTGTFPVPVTASETAEPLTHRESERGE